jgi:chemotaxis protein MotB
MDSSPHSPSRQRLASPSLNSTPIRRWRPPVEDDVGWWPITFSDLVLLLLCFVVLWHVAEKRRQKPQPQFPLPIPFQLKTANPPETVQQFVPVAVTIPPAATEQAVASKQPEQSPVSPAPVEPPALQSSPPDSSWQDLQREFEQYVHAEGLDRTVGVVSSERGLVISLSDTITFPSGQATLNPEVAPLLARVAELAARRPDLSLEIAGHTDDRPIATVEFPSNWELSAARASRVARALLDQGSIDPTRISTRGYAHYRPLYANDNDIHRAANRRVEIRFFRQVG